jgi:hypothetical protein
MTTEAVTGQQPSQDRIPIADPTKTSADLQAPPESAPETADNAAELQSLQRAIEAGPDDARIQSAAQDLLLKTLKQDAFLGYLSETDKTYTVSLSSQAIDIPKARARYDTYPPTGWSESQRLVRLVLWMTLGLLPLGIGTLLILPYALWRSIRLLSSRDLDPVERRRGLVALLIVLCLGILGLGLFGLLLLHLTG